MSRDWAVSVHDVAPDTWPACRRLLGIVTGLGARATLLVTPHLHCRRRVDEDPAFVRALRARVARGDEIVLHGYYHWDDGPRPTTPADWFQRRVLTAAEGEFAALDVSEAARRVAAGTQLLSRVGLRPVGFVAPAWLLGSGARAALAASGAAPAGSGHAGAGLAYTSTRDFLYALPEFEPIAAPSLVYSTRSAWRRAISRRWNRRRLAALEHVARLRAALHPADAAHPDVLDDWADLLAALARDRRPVLESSWLPVRASAASAPARPREPASPARAAAG